uniref:EGF-like domain-containing protein n=1 Tax=Schistosoma curassoni TaxID=6186 RepID=A0A183JV86_9TREM
MPGKGSNDVAINDEFSPCSILPDNCVLTNCKTIRVLGISVRAIASTFNDHVVGDFITHCHCVELVWNGEDCDKGSN